MNIQDEIQKIHHKFSVSEMANYRIEQFIEDLIEKEKEQLRLHIVSNQRELLIAYELNKLKYVSEAYAQGMAEKTVDKYLSNL